MSEKVLISKYIEAILDEWWRQHNLLKEKNRSIDLKDKTIADLKAVINEAIKFAKSEHLDAFTSELPFLRQKQEKLIDSLKKARKL